MKRITTIFTILLALFLLCNISFAETEYRYFVDNSTACDCNINGAYLIAGGSFSGLSASCTYYHEAEDNVEGAYIRKLSSSFTSWDKIDSTKDSLNIHKKIYETDLEQLKNSDRRIIVESFETKDSFSLISRPVNVGNEYRNSEKKQFEYIVHREIIYDDYALIKIIGHWRTLGEEPQDTSVITTIDAMEACMKKVIDNSLSEQEKEASIKVEHEHPFPYLLEDAWLSSTDSLVGGEIRATVLDDDGKPEAGRIVVFYIEKDDPLHGAISSHTHERFYKTTTTWREIEKNIDNVDLRSYVGFAVTDKNGLARMNYLFRKRLNMQKLSAKIVLGKGEVEGKMQAAVIDIKKKEPELSSSVDLKFNYIAKIISISGNGVPDVLPEGDMQGVVSGPGQVRVKRILVEPLTYDEVKTGHELMPGDIINVDADSKVEIMWINGDRVIAKLPRYVSVAEKVIYPSANMILLGDAYSSGFPSTIGKGSDIAYGMVIEKGWNFLVDTIKSEIPGSGIVDSGYSFIVGIAEKFEEYDAADLSKFSIISRIRVKSQFIVDTTGDEMKISVIDGNPDIENADGEITLNNGEAVIFSEDEMGTVEKLDKDNLKDWEIPEIREDNLEENEGSSSGSLFIWLVLIAIGTIIFIVLKKKKKPKKKQEKMDKIKEEI